MATRSGTRRQYWSEFKGNYLTGDGARRDEDGYFWIVGRIDDVLNVAGIGLARRKSKARLSVIRELPKPRLSAGRTSLKGQGVVAFVTLKGTMSRC